MTQKPVLSVKNLNVSFGKTTVVRNLSFDIAPGQTLALVGESGSGKSVTSLAIMGLLPERTGRATGSVMLDDQELLTLPEAQMRRVRGGRISMIFQEPMTSMNPVQRIGDQLAEVIQIHRGLRGEALKQAAIEMLRKVRIPDPETRMRQYPHTFSGGMRQRVMIAMALACDPAVIIADEPTTALDVTVQAQTLALLKDLQKETGTAVLFITHDMGVVAEVADDVLVMRRGDVIESGPVEQVFSAPAHQYTRSLIEAVPSLVGKLTHDTIPAQPVQGVPVTFAGDDPVLDVRNMTVRFPVHRGGFR